MGSLFAEGAVQVAALEVGLEHQLLFFNTTVLFTTILFIQNTFIQASKGLLLEGFQLFEGGAAGVFEVEQRHLVF